MLDIFHGLRLVVKRRSISIDNAIFRCHWFFTSTLLVSFSVIITARQYVGQPIECHSMNKIPNSLLNSYCWVQSTFTVPQACNRQLGLDVPYPCIDNTRGREIKVYAYYQWVGMVLFVQGLLFHLPYYLWKVWENGLISAITSGLRVAVLSDQERTKKREIVVEYMHEHMGCHRRYAYKYFLCEFICLINLIGQIWSVNRFFDGQFLTYGLEVIQYSANNHHNYPASVHTNNNNNKESSSQSTFNPSYQHQQTAQLQSNNNDIPSNNNFQNQQQDNYDNQTLTGGSSRVQTWLAQHRANNRQLAPIDPMSFVFPRITKCTYYDFGSSGDVQKHDAICLLPLNIINEKIYIALWFWFFLLAFLTAVVVIFRLFAIFSPAVRCRGLLSRCKLANRNHVELIIEVCDVGDWFLFYMVAENVDPIVMREIVASLAGKLSEDYEMKKGLGNCLDGGDKLVGVPEVTPNSEHYHHINLTTNPDLDPSNAIIDQEPPDGGGVTANGIASQQIRHVRYDEHDPRQWRSTTQEPAERDQQHTFQEQNDSLLLEAGGISSSSAQLRPLSRTIAQANECLPLPKQSKFKKRLYSKRLWSMDLGPGNFRRQLLFGERPREPQETLFAPSSILAGSSATSILDQPRPGGGVTNASAPSQQHHYQAQPPPPTFRLHISAPPDSQLSGLDSAPPPLQGSQPSTPTGSTTTLHRRRHHHNHYRESPETTRSQLLSPLSRSHSGFNSASSSGGGGSGGAGSGSNSTQSACDSFVLEMQSFGGRRLSPSPVSDGGHFHCQQHAHHQSISSMRDWDLPSSRRC